MLVCTRGLHFLVRSLACEPLYVWFFSINSREVKGAFNDKVSEPLVTMSVVDFFSHAKGKSCTLYLTNTK